MFKKFALFAMVFVLLTGSAYAEMKTITFASDATWPPMEFVDSNKQMVGFAIDYMTKAAELGGFKAEFKNVAWDGIFAGLAGGQYDAICSSVSITEERKAKMDFSVPYFQVKQAVVVRKDATYKSLEELKGKPVGSQISTTGTFAVKAVEGIESKTYDEVGLAIEDLFNGRLEAVVCDDPVAANYALQNEKYKGALKIAVVIESTEVEYYGIAVQKGNAEALELINKGIEAVKASGYDKELLTKWIGR